MSRAVRGSQRGAKVTAAAKPEAKAKMTAAGKAKTTAKSGVGKAKAAKGEKQKGGRVTKAPAAKVAKGGWVEGHGWDEGKLAERRFVTARDLDVVARYQRWFTLGSVALVAIVLVYQVVGRRGMVRAVETLEDELGED